MRRKWWWLLVLLVLLLAGTGLVAWGTQALGPMPAALTALQSDAEVQVTTERWLVFEPVNQAPTTGLVLYPGGRVDPRSYAPAAREIAAKGTLVIIVPMPLNLAVIGPERATEVIAAFPAVQHWAVGGHSLGGAMAARYVYRNPERAEGLVLWAAYPAESDDLSGLELEVVSIYATRDGLASPDEIAASRARLPANTHWVAIEGGNHAQFGWYGAQDGDNQASVSREVQQQQVVAATVELLSQFVE